MFAVFSSWLRCVKECLEDIWEVTGTRLLTENSSLIHKVTQLIWNNAESPVEGVSEFVYNSFRVLLEIYSLECERFSDTEKPLYTSLLQRVIALPWQAKAKYFPLCALIPYLGTGKVLEHFTELPRHLLNCLSTNYLSPCASEVYKTMIQRQRQELCAEADHTLLETELAQEWARHWLDTLSVALTSEVTLLQNNTSSYLLPWTLRTFPAAFKVLTASFSLSSPGHLRAWVTLLSAQRMVTTGPLPLEGTVLEKLRLGLHSLDDAVRLGALGFLCCSPKTNQALTQLELGLLKEFLPLNLTCDSSPFRQLLQAAMKKALVRIRESCLACLRKGKANSRKGENSMESMEPVSVLSQGVEFVEWLVQLAVSSLAPGLNFQRKKTALLLLAAVLETCTDSWTPDKKKGQPPENMCALINWSRERGRWDFFTEANLLVLLGCLHDSTNEIRELTAELLVKFFPLCFPETLTAALLEHAGKAMRSPRVQEAQAGAIMMKIVYQKSETLSSLLENNCKERNDSAQDVKSVSFLLYLLCELDDHCITAARDMLQAARTRPIHGVITALQKYLVEVPDALISIQKATTNGQGILSRLVETVRKISLFLLGVLYGNQSNSAEEQEAPPSFADMGNAIQSLITQGRGLEQQDGGDAVLLSEEHSLILTCCWVSVKEIGILLGNLVEKALAPPTATTGSLLSIEDLQTIAKVFQEILLKCRHWGAVEGCCVGFTKFCSVLLNHHNPDMKAIPRRMLEQGLSVLNTPRSSSVTRRAAGLPMLILCIIAGEEASKSRPLLARSMSVVLEIAGTPLPDDWDQTLDLQQVCAVHILQTLVRGSGLGVAMLQFATAMTILSLKALSSPCWAMRNAAIQLFSALCARMLGQRRSRHDSSAQNGMSPAAFFTHYPELKGFLLQELQRAGDPGQGSGEGRLHLFPSLHSVLTLLARLQPGVEDEARSLSVFLDPLLQLAGSPIHAVRVMAAKALVAMVSPSEQKTVLLRLVDELPGRKTPCSHNHLHGQLLQIEALLARALDTNELQPDAMQSLVLQFESKSWLVMSSKQCPLIRSACLRVATMLIRNCSQSFVEHLQEVLVKELHTPTCRLQLGSAVFRQAAARFLCDEAVRTGPAEQADQASQLLMMEDPDIRLAVVSWITEGRRWKCTRMWNVLKKRLKDNLQTVLEERNGEYLKVYLEAFVVMTGVTDREGQIRGCPVLSEGPAPLSEPDSGECVETLLSMLERAQSSPDLLSHALCAASLLLADSTDAALLERWCELLERYSDPDSTETLRLAAARSLQLVGVTLVHKTLNTPAPRPSLARRLVNTGVYLLQDEDPRVRGEAAKFASLVNSLWRKLPGERSCLHFQSSKGLLCLLELLLQEFGAGRETLELFLSHLPGSDMGSVLQELEEAESVSLYEQDEANVFAEPAAIAQLLLPYLLQLIEKMAFSSDHRESVAHWITTNAAGILQNVGCCKLWCSRGAAAAPGPLSALGCPRLHSAVTALFVRATVLLHAMEILGEEQAAGTGTGCTPQRLRLELEETHRLLTRHGVFIPLLRL
ncbi:thyroid adenoma-associated protein homolog [Polyodon spathula]|uniref:thyroid adenoma-associated protein homolog n=1 Tax=Polyodon spathula TaxID=7913 RepID=UPI001B7E8493|nr:thyroid adenoma-associated protein homolog [Polyodon spathula]